MVRTQIQLYAEQIQWLKKIALQRSVSMAQVIRDSIDAYRANEEQKQALYHRKKKALSAVGSFSSIPHNDP